MSARVSTRSLKAYCGGLPDASSRLYAPPSNVLVYYVRQRKFAYFKTSEPERWRFSFRVTPDRFLELTDVPGIKPARYMARHHWVTVVDLQALPAAYLYELVDASYQRALLGPRKKPGTPREKSPAKGRTHFWDR